MSSLGDRLREERDKKGLTQKDLARLAGCEQPVISDLEKGVSKGSKHLIRFAKILGVSPFWLEDGTSPKHIQERNDDPAIVELVELLAPLSETQRLEIIGAVKLLILQQSLSQSKRRA